MSNLSGCHQLVLLLLVVLIERQQQQQKRVHGTRHTEKKSHRALLMVTYSILFIEHVKSLNKQQFLALTPADRAHCYWPILIEPECYVG